LDDGQPEDRPLKREEGGNWEDNPKVKHGGGGSIYDWQQIKSQF
jgi:hypothetical protein